MFLLFKNLNSGNYRHGSYQSFTVSDNKKREICVAGIRDRVVHRLLYDYLVSIFDKTFIYDVWSCREDKGLIEGINRTQTFLHSYKNSYVWRADIKKFFDSVNHEILLNIIMRRVRSSMTSALIANIIGSFSKTPGTGMPIGNLTSQIFSNIYLNELDRYVKHTIKPQAYMRYGDDLIIIEKDKAKLEQIRTLVDEFLTTKLKLTLHAKNNIIVKARHGIKFLGVVIYPQGRRLNKRAKGRAFSRLSTSNLPSYSGLIKQHGNKKLIKEFQWHTSELLIIE